MGFCDGWVSLVRQCISTVTFSVKVNGEPLPFFQPSRGIRQGDPMSPYLFIMLANVHSFLMKQEIEDENLKGIKLNSNCPILSHLLIANDAIFFLDGTVNECLNLANVLNRYCFASG